jgi:tight adherence protein C
MEVALQYINQWMGDPQRASWLFAVVAGLAVTLIIAAGSLLVSASGSPLKQRLRRLTGQTDATADFQFQVMQAARALAPLLSSKNTGEQNRIRLELVQAGYRGRQAVSVFYGAKILLCLVLAGLVLFLAPMVSGIQSSQIMMALGVSAAIGLLLPSVYVSRRRKHRQTELMGGFPDALDLLVACTEAGLGLNAALARVASEMSVSHRTLAEELELVNAEIRAGVDRIRALKSLADRTGLDEIRGLVSLLAQSMQFGTSVADALRVYADEFRDKRMQRAEELAAKMGTKLIFPLLLCMFPSFFIVAVGPAVVRLMSTLQAMF